jgi:hypothetical protein
VLGAGGNAVNPCGYATYGLNDWATTDPAGAPAAGTSPYTIIGLSSVTGGYQSATMGNNFDVQANYTFGSANVGATTARFNTPAANNINVHGKWFYPGAILVTPNMGAVNHGSG